ncbi:hypothetical protein, partial [Bradyrhizobium sp. 1]|uniref:hypothetical protein n=1 Tax=Bradyrhizobium sp. 1 TaxID=241591 RepID=UPI001FFB155A
RAADRGCEVSTRPSLHPLGLEGGEIKQSSGETCRENARPCLLFKNDASTKIPLDMNAAWRPPVLQELLRMIVA